MLYGTAGIGKTTVLRALTNLVRRAEPDAVFLHCEPSEPDRLLPLSALADLLAGDSGDDIGADAMAAAMSALPGRQRSVLVGLCRGELTHVSERLAVRIAVRDFLAELGRDGRPVLLALDNAQWIDPASAAVLEFSLGRMGPARLRVVAAERVSAGGAPAATRLCPDGGTEVEVPSLPAGALIALVRARAGDALPGWAARRICAVSDGNPWFAVEIAAAAAHRDRPLQLGEPLPVPARLRALVAPQLAQLSAAAMETLLFAAATDRPTIELLRRAGRSRVAEDLAEAAGAAVADLDYDGVIRFSYPLLAAVVYDRAPGIRRAAVHAALAGVVEDPVARARHRALGDTANIRFAAAELDRAAELAAGRGSPAAAAELAALAARRTSTVDGDLVVERTLRTAEYAAGAAMFDLARPAAENVLAVAVRPSDRVRAGLVLLDAAGQGLVHAAGLFNSVLVDAGDDPALLAPVRVWVGIRYLLEGRLVEARVEAQQAVSLAEIAGDEAVRGVALQVLSMAQLYLGDPNAERTIERAFADSVGAFGSRAKRARLWLMSGRLVPARNELAQLAVTADRLGLPSQLWMVLPDLIDAEVRLGNCAAALQFGARGLRLTDEADLGRGPVLFSAALAEAAGGSLQRAGELARGGVAASEADADRLMQLRSSALDGHVSLLAGRPAEALGPLRRAGKLSESMGIGEPALCDWQADLAEAYIRLGNDDRARTVIERAVGQAEHLDRSGVLAALGRAEGLRLASIGQADGAADVLQAAADRFAMLSMPLEHGRTLLELARMERRRRHRSAAERASENALEIFERAGAQPWLEKARSEAGTPDAVRTAGPVLTADERQVTAMAIGGATNAEIARTLFVSVKTVEAKLSRIYRKVGVRSRRQLALKLGNSSDSDGVVDIAAG
ncbi:LuxR family transcriptional regulator [Fodinicola feengrottensis]|uniref:LuxR family transcriptional regulator n=1 Tax=Fodinicola feengrottensis TaxID=435914 RepID=A0ABN2GDN9_9ACTN